MNRRFFMLFGLFSGAALTLSRQAQAKPSTAAADVCIMKLDQITTEATGYTRYEHHHQLSIPVSVLINPPDEGFKIRTSTLDQGSLDEEAFKAFIKETGLDGNALRHHSHEVKFTKEELERIAQGEKEVKITVLSPKGNFAHEFFFTAPRSALIKIQRGRAAKQA